MYVLNSSSKNIEKKEKKIHITKASLITPEVKMTFRGGKAFKDHYLIEKIN